MPTVRRAGRTLRLAASVALLGSLACASAAQAVNVSGTIGNATWTVAGGPYVLVDDVTVTGTLTIEPGVVVSARGTTGTGGRLPDTELAVAPGGRLEARGTQSQPIQFGGFLSDGHASPSPWAGIYLDNAAAAVFEHVVVSTARNGIRSVNTALTVSNSRFNSGGGAVAGGIYASSQGAAFAPAITIKDSVLENSTNGIRVDVEALSPAGTVTADRNRVTGAPVGLRLTSAAAAVTLKAHGNLLQGNGTGLRLDSGSTSTFDIASNTIVGNDIGVHSTSLTTPDNAALNVTQNNIYANSTYDWRADNLDPSRATITAESNYWGSPSPAVVDSHIFDTNDDASRALVDYLPLRSSPSPTAPAAAAPDTLSPGGPPAITNATTATVAFSSSQAASTFQCSLDNSPWDTCSPPATLSNLGDGSHTFAIRALDPAGIADPTPVIHVWRVDTAPPQTTITSGPSGTTRSSAATFSFTTTEGGVGSGFECKLDARAWAPCATPASFSGLGAGTHTFRVRARDRAGNVDPTEAVRSWAVAGPSAAAPRTPAAPALVVDLAVAKRLTLRRFLRGMAASANRAGTFAARFKIGRRDAKKLKTGTLLATGRATLRTAGSVNMKPKLTRKARRALRRIRRLRVVISTTFTSAGGQKVTTRDVVNLRR